MIESQKPEKSKAFQVANKKVALEDNKSAATLLSLSQGEPLESFPNAPSTLSSALVEVSNKFADKKTVYLHSDGSSSTQSYKDLLQRALKILAGLRKQGLEPQDKVILQLEDNQEFTEGFWACILGGFVVIPLAIASADEPSNDATKALYHSWQVFDRPLVLTDRNLSPKINSLFSQWNREEAQIASIEDLGSFNWDKTEKWHWGEPEDLILIFLNARYGNIPKGAQLSHRNIISNITAHVQKGWMNSDDTYLNWLPLCNPGPLLRSVIWTTYLGCQQIQGEAATVLGNPLKWLDWIEQYRVTITWSPNFALALLNDLSEKIKQGSWDLSSVKYWLNTAEPIVPQTAQITYQLLKSHGLKEGVMHGSWGMKETAASATDSDRYASESQLSKDNVLADLGSPLPGVALRIVNDCYDLIPEQTIGNLQVKGDTVFSGYYKSPELNREVFTDDGWYKTGDLGFLSGGSLTLTGRSKALIIINGKNHYSHEIEQVVEEIVGVEPGYTAACGIRQPSSNTDSVVLFFHTSIGDQEELVELLKEIKKSVVLKMGISPTHIIPVEPAAIPKTSKGIIDRPQLQQSFALGEFNDACQTVKNLLIEASLSQTTAYLAPKTATELKLASIWQELLGVERIGRHDNFFELGGHSLLATQMLSHVQNVFSVNLPMQKLFGSPTVAELALGIKQLPQTEHALSSFAVNPGSTKKIPLSLTQRRFWSLEELQDPSPLFNIPRALEIEGPLNLEIFIQSLQTIVERHANLRTTLYLENEVVYQQVHDDATVTPNLIDLQKIPLSKRKLVAYQLLRQEVQKPFKLTEEYLIRFSLSRLSADSYIFAVNIHHIICDAWSIKIFWQELALIYNSLVEGKPNPLAPLPIQYADFVHWQQQYLKGDEAKENHDFWSQQLADLPTEMNLPFDRERSSQTTYSLGKGIYFTVDEALSQQIKRFCSTRNITLYMLFLAVWQLLLCYYSGREDVAVFSTISGRDQFETQHSIGLFANALLLRTQCRNNLMFEELLAQVRQNCLAAHAHQQISLKDLKAQLEIKQDIKSMPIVSFLLDNNATRIDDNLQMAGLEISNGEGISSWLTVDDLQLVLEDAGWEEFRLSLFYKSDLFDDSTAEQIISEFQQLLNVVIRYPEKTVNELLYASNLDRSSFVSYRS